MTIDPNLELPRKLLIVSPKRLAPILICSKCVRKAPKGKAIRSGLKKLLKAASCSGGKTPKLVETKCLGICPRKAVVVASGATLAVGRMILMRERDVSADAIRILAGDTDASTAK